VTAPQEEVGREDPPSPATTAASVDLVEMFFQLARVNAALSAQIDRSLRAKHGLTFEAYDAMTAIAEQPEGSDEKALAAALGLTLDDIGGIVDSLVLSAYATRTARPDGAGPAAVLLTLRGTLVLKRASRSVDQELERRLGTVVSPEALARLEDALAVLRQRPAPVKRRPRVQRAGGTPRYVAADG
jgi:DNA-binding MarR family transcriptional regulator